MEEECHKGREGQNIKYKIKLKSWKDSQSFNKTLPFERTVIQPCQLNS